MRLLLIQPPVEDFYDTDIRLQPIGLAYLKAAVNKWLPEVEVVIRDYHHGWGRKTVPVPPELRYLRDYYAWPDKSPFSAFHCYFRFGASGEEIADDAARIKPDIIGISSLFSPYYREALRTAEVLKNKLNVPILLGGSHVSAMPEEMLSHPAVDFIIRGEGEKPLVEFLKAWSAGEGFGAVPNLGYKNEGKLFLNPEAENFEIEALPIPELEDFSPETYLFEGKPLSFMITSRSCPHRCTFCSVHRTFGFTYRRRPVESVMAEIEQRYREGYRVIDFEDDNLTFYKNEMKELCRRLIAAFPGREMRFVAMNGISYLSLDDELLHLMKDAGFTNLNLALVSSDITVRETTKRPHTIKKYLEVVETASRLGFHIVSYQILGLPNESLESMIQTLVFGASQPVLLGASMFYLTPNSPIARGFPAPLAADVFKSRLTAMAFEGNGFTREDIYTLFITTRILNFLKSVESGRGETLTFEEALLRLEQKDVRSAKGVEALNILLAEGVLHADTSHGWKLLKKFRMETFVKVWSAVSSLAAQSGARITGLASVQKFEAKGSCDDQEDAENAQELRGFVEKQNADDSCARGADPGPDRVGRAHGEGSHRLREKVEADTHHGENVDRRP